MIKKDELNNLLKQRNGYLLTSEALELNISKPYLSEYIKKMELEKVAHGIYRLPEAWSDDLYIMCLRNKKAIYSHDTALMLHGLTEHEPSQIHTTVPKAYNATHLRNKGFVVYQVKDEWLNLGETRMLTAYGNEVKVYDMERTVCDILRAHSKKDPQMLSYALKEYVKKNNKNLSNLMKYATVFNIENEIRQYMEVLL